ncbi:Anucleate primary sterigmata protein A [Penicillium macrosclerotiorum]|uniref:Anucleate primary sterigmata protein A n=1 Tax=Penicillium macrosclerotiorum TaxID=303699 RepID=UPI00254915CD|nr:Anucleate primary sterigmata protein A [Penicillium macrosclerotiorum]KAJ5688967.1 Anucleate primary sterigmata protein A [Penicillium macrosclerotiorum]
MTASNAGANSTLASMMEDPFVSNSSQAATAPRESHRYSSFDTQLFSLNASSPAQAKRALEAHLAETERRLEEASKLGTALIDQQRELTEQLKEVERQQDEGEMGPELRQRLADLEQEYNEIGRESARAFLAPKRLAGGSEDTQLGTPSFDQKSPISPALFASQATNSPSKVSVPSRKQRNQPSSRVHDIEFATEISTSLLAQVRQLQALLAEREESLKSVNLEKSRLELEAEGYAQRIRTLDDSEQRYKDENWALETQTHELMAAVKDATEREKRLNTSLSASNSEKTAVERELEELRQANSKLLEEQSIAQKANDAEVHLLRRNLTAGDAEKLALQKKLEELTGQNQELAKAVAMRIRQYEGQGTRDLPDDNDDDEQEQNTPDNSPPPSPNKFTPRHGHLESETLKSSLGHAHRMIQNLKSTIHREKTEKIELKRMLQEARDEVEQRRRETAAPNGSTKRLKTKDTSFRKPARPDLLGAGRKEKSFVELHDTDWEDNAGQISPSRSVMAIAAQGRPGARSPDEPSDVYQTATEAEDGFETANERATATESEAFQTGVESMADDSSDDSADLTETENNVQTTPRNRVSSLMMAKARDRSSFHSTASASTDDEETDGSFPSPSQTHMSRRVRSKRSVLRRIRPSGEAPMASYSRPSSARNSPAPSFEEQPMAQEGQSLFAELAELEGGEEEDEEDGAVSQTSTPRMGPVSDSRRPSEVNLDVVPRPVMVDSGVMTDPWEPSTSIATVAGAGAAGVLTGAILTNSPTTPQRSQSPEQEIATNVEQTPKLVSSGTQWTPLKPPTADGDHLANVPTPPKMVWDERSVDVQHVEAGTQAEPAEMGVAIISFQETVPTAPKWPELGVTFVPGSVTSPVKHEVPAPEILDLGFSSISSLSTEPVMAVIPESEPVRELPEISLSSLFTYSTEPVQARVPEPEPEIVAKEVILPDLGLSIISAQQTEPVKPHLPEPAPVPEPIVIREVIREPAPEPVPPELSISWLNPTSTEPVEARLPEPVPVPEPVVIREVIREPAPEPVPPELSISWLNPTSTEPVEARLPEPAPLPEPIVIREVIREPAPEPVPPELSISWLDPAFTEPIAPKLIEAAPLASPSISILHSVETQPTKSVPHVIPSMIDLAVQTDPTEEPKPVGSAVAVYEDTATRITRSRASTTTSERRTSTGLALSDISGNALPHSGRQQPSSVSMDQGSQTILSARQIDQILMDRDSARPVSSADNRPTSQIRDMATAGAIAAVAGASAASSPFATPKVKSRLQPQSAKSNASSQRRPDSSASQASAFSLHPPLPVDHREAIAAAEKKSIDMPPPSPTVMGPPLAPASAYRINVQAAPRTPNEQMNRPGSTRTVSTQARMRKGSQSQMSRRSSVSSFASELEERFNMNPYAGPMPQGYGPGTDPRMIQAITQTMIGEFLWKYTRKTGSSDMSSTRHRRYFWVHPYTRTLYWSEQDPQTVGKTQVRTKSVPIEAVRVVADDNPYPPGLHCRSLEVVSPGRRVRFTATTSQRHETWFNALSYLLLRETNDNCEDHDNSVTLDDIDEFNPGFRSSSRQTARMSLASHNSRTVRQAPKQQRAASAMSMRSTGGTPGRASPALSSPGPNSTLQVPDEPPRSSSRLSSILNSSIRGSIASLKGRHGQASSVHNESLRDQHSMENLAQELDDEDRLENVRACCDGKHDVGSLSRTSRYSPRVDRTHSHH